MRQTQHPGSQQEPLLHGGRWLGEKCSPAPPLWKFPLSKAGGRSLLASSGARARRHGVGRARPHTGAYMAMGWPAMAEWVAAAREEPEEIEELDMEF